MTIRDDFEAWMKNPHMLHRRTEPGYTDEYDHPWTAGAWAAWQVRHAEVDEMENMHWEDTSSFSRGEKDRTPKCWTANAGRFQIVVHHHMHWPPETWLLSCHGLRIDNLALDSVAVADAKQEAIAIVRKQLQEAIKAIH